MFQTLDCLVGRHDYRLVVLAALLCILAAGTTLQLFKHARRFAGPARGLWLGVAGLTGGFGIWSTHFVAMLAFAPGVPSGYDIVLTGLSLFYATALTGGGLWVALAGPRRIAPWLGGALVGCGVATMHYTGMAAFQVAGEIGWSTPVVIVSVALSLGLCSLAVLASLAPGLRHREVVAAALLTLGICGHHFTSMGAMAIRPDPRIAVVASAIPTGALAVAVSLASMLLLLFAGAALMLDLRDRRSAQENARLHSLANAAVEGLLVCQGDTIVFANDSVLRLVGRPSLAGAALSDLLAGLPAEGLAGPEPSDTPLEVLLLGVDQPIPVEIIAKPIDYAGQPHQAVAVRDLRSRKQAERQIHFLAHHDDLTGLPNRASFHARLEEELRLATMRDSRLTVVLMDVDHFKTINDTLGHDGGDLVLKTVADRIRRTIRPSDLVGRLGGDELAILLAPTPEDNVSEQLLAAVQSAIREPMDLGSRTSRVSTSMGAAVFPSDGQSVTELVKCADLALYSAKEAGRDRWRRYTPVLMQATSRRTELQDQAFVALRQNAFCLHYQPIVSMVTGRVLIVEAQLRWNHPSLGVLPPSRFAAVFEKPSLAAALGDRISELAVAQAADWHRARVAFGKIAFNVTAPDFETPAFVDALLDRLAQHGLSARQLAVEVTEGMFLGKAAGRARTELQRLGRAGVSIVFDQFGTGYASLTQLKELPIGHVKVDRSFVSTLVRDPASQNILRGIIHLAHGLDLGVTAEGVECEAQAIQLRQMGCDRMQGPLLAHPMPASELPPVIERLNAGATLASAA